MIAEAAYYLAERRRFETGHELEDWLAAEIEIDRGGKQALAEAPDWQCPSGRPGAGSVKVLPQAAPTRTQLITGKMIAGRNDDERSYQRRPDF